MPNATTSYCNARTAPTTNPHSHEAAGVVIQLIAAPHQDAPTSATKLQRSAALEVVLRGKQDLLPHADRVLVRLAGLGLVVGDRR